jgi:hypothetical protein
MPKRPEEENEEGAPEILTARKEIQIEGQA